MAAGFGKEDSYERNPSGVSFVFNPPSGGIYAPGRSPPPAGGGIQTPAPRAADAFEGGGPTCPPPFAAPGRRRKPGLAAATERTHCGRRGPPWRRATGGPRPILTRAGDGPGQAKGWPPPPGAAGSPQKPPRRHGGTASTRTAGGPQCPQARPLDADHLGGGLSPPVFGRAAQPADADHGGPRRARPHTTSPRDHQATDGRSPAGSRRGQAGRLQCRPHSFWSRGRP